MGFFTVPPDCQVTRCARNLTYDNVNAGVACRSGFPAFTQGRINLSHPRSFDETVRLNLSASGIT